MAGEQTILLVEDQSIIALAQQDVLERHGFRVLTALDGAEALRTVRTKERIDLVLMDIDLGGEADGTDVAREILRVREVPVVFLTSHGEPEFIDRVREVTRYGLVLKSAGEAVLLGSIHMALQLFEAHVRLAAKEREARTLAARLSQYERIVKNTSELVSVTDENDRFTFVNAEHERLLGYRPDELLGTSAADLLHPDDLRSAVEKHERLRDERRSSVDVWRFRHKDGTYRTLECRASVYIDEYDRKATVVVSHDITDRIRVENALRESEKMMRYIIKHDPNAIAVYDRDLRYIAASDRYLHDYGVSDVDVEGKHHYEVFPEMPERWKEVHRRVLEGATERNDDDWFERSDGSITYNRWECRPWYTADGAIGGMITYTEVTTERKLAEQKLRAALQDKGRLLRELNHRVKNNLATVISLIRLKSSKLGEAVDLSDIINMVGAMRGVHERLQQTENPTEVKLREYVQEIVASVFSYSVRTPAVLEVDVEDLVVSTDMALHLGLILSELATNAATHGFEGLDDDDVRRFSVDMRLDEEAGAYVLTVRNTGRPFPEDIGLDHPKTLGLRLVSGLVSRMKGRIELERHPDTTFTIAIPKRG